MSKVKQVVEEETNTTAPEGFKSLMSKVKQNKRGNVFTRTGVSNL